MWFAGVQPSTLNDSWGGSINLWSNLLGPSMTIVPSNMDMYDMWLMDTMLWTWQWFGFSFQTSFQSQTAACYTALTTDTKHWFHVIQWNPCCLANWHALSSGTSTTWCKRHDRTINQLMISENQHCVFLFLKSCLLCHGAGVCHSSAPHCKGVFLGKLQFQNLNQEDFGGRRFPYQTTTLSSDYCIPLEV